MFFVPALAGLGRYPIPYFLHTLIDHCFVFVQEYLGLFRQALEMLYEIQASEVSVAHEEALQATIDSYSTRYSAFVSKVEIEKHAPKDGFEGLVRYGSRLG